MIHFTVNYELLTITYRITLKGHRIFFMENQQETLSGKLCQWWNAREGEWLVRAYVTDFDQPSVGTAWSQNGRRAGPRRRSRQTMAFTRRVGAGETRGSRTVERRT